MSRPLLVANTQIPPLRTELVRRERLIRLLDERIPTSRLTLVTAPPGYGKTTLLVQWAQEHEVKPVWLTLDARQNDPAEFFRALVFAWSQVETEILHEPLGLLLGSSEPDMDLALQAFAESGAADDRQRIFIIDNGEQISDDRLLQLFAQLLDYLPPTMHFMIASRTAPAIPVARLRAAGLLFDLDSETLGFRLDETRHYLAAQHADASEASAAALQHRFEGWIAGMHLALQEPEIRRNVSRLSQLEGTPQFVGQYLLEEVLSQLPASTRQFLLETSIVSEEMTANLCDFITGRTDSEQILHELVHQGLFCSAIGAERSWYRYHSLFADVLQRRLQAESHSRLLSLHQKAAQWYLDHAMPEQAFIHALKANDHELALQVGKDYGVIKLECGEVRLVADWVRSIPEEWYARYPQIQQLRLAYQIFTGEVAAVQQTLAFLDQYYAETEFPEKRVEQAKLDTIRCVIACFQNNVPEATAYGAKALQDLPNEEVFYIASIYHALGETYQRNGMWTEAKQSLLTALNTVHAPSHRFRSVHIYGALADLELRQGRLRDAWMYWTRAEQVIESPDAWGRFPIPVNGWVAIRMGELNYERNELEEAERRLKHGLELAQLGGDTRSLIAGNLLKARLQLSRGDATTADHLLAATAPLLDQTSMPELLTRFDRLQLELWFDQGRLRSASDWAALMPADGVRGPEYEPEADQLSLARVLICKDLKADCYRALSLLQGISASADVSGRLSVLIEALCLQAIAHAKCGARSESLRLLSRALTLAEPEGHHRLFVDLGAPMQSLMKEVEGSDQASEYAAELLQIWSQDDQVKATTLRGLQEPLSDREKDVLQLLVSGLTNREISDRLFISPETVKKHTSHIYAKLDVSNRTEAVSRAIELGLTGYHR